MVLKTSIDGINIIRIVNTDQNEIIAEWNDVKHEYTRPKTWFVKPLGLLRVVIGSTNVYDAYYNPETRKFNQFIHNTIKMKNQVLAFDLKENLVCLPN